MSIQHFLQDVEKGLRSPVYFLYASDSYLLKEASLIASHALPEPERGFSVTVYDLDSVDEKPSFDQVRDVLNTMPFMGGRRIVIVENVQEVHKKDVVRIGDYVSNPSPHAVLLLLHQGSVKALLKDLVKKTRSISLDIRPQDFPLWIKERARRKGLVLTDRAVEYLIGLIGPDAGLISSELEKFVLIGKSHIDRDDMIGIVSGSKEYTVFDLVDAIHSKDAGKVFKIARALQNTADPYSLLGAINWHYGRMSLRDKGKEAYYDRVFGLLNEADVGIKTSGGTFPLEYLLIRLLQA